MTRTNARHAPVVGDPREDDTSMPIRTAHDRIDDVIVGNRIADLSDELGGKLLAVREETTDIELGEHDGQRGRKGANA